MIKILNTYTVSLALIALWGVSVGAGAEEVTMEDRCKSEVIELHRFFQDWFNAEFYEKPWDNLYVSRIDKAGFTDTFNNIVHFTIFTTIRQTLCHKLVH